MAERKQGLWLGYGRYPHGRTLQRIKRAESRIEAYLTGQLDRIDELEVEILPFTDFLRRQGIRSHNSQPVAYYCDSFNHLHDPKQEHCVL